MSGTIDQARTVSIIGVGNMGGAMAARLIDTGWAVRVRDIDTAKEDALVQRGAIRCADSAGAAAGCSALIICVVDGAQAFEAVAAADIPAGCDLILCPTIAPSDVEAITERMRERGVATIDAPMSGGPLRAREGTMSLMVACEPDVFERQRVLLNALSDCVFRVSNRPGDGARTKLVNNLLAGINLAGAAEAMALAQRLGLNLAATLDVIERSSGQSWIGSDRMRRAIAGDYEPRAHVTLLQKDIGLALRAAHESGFDGRLGAAAHEVFNRAALSGLSGLDDAALFRLLCDS